MHSVAAPDELSRETEDGRNGSPGVNERNEKASLDRVTVHQPTTSPSQCRCLNGAT